MGLLTLLNAARAFGQVQYYLPHVVNGGSGGRVFRTTFIFFNNSNVDIKASLKLTNDSGTPLTAVLGGVGPRSDFNIYVSAGGSQILQTDGSGALVTGAATVSAPSSLGVSAIFGLYDATGRFLTEAGVGAAAPVTAFVMPVDTTGQFNTGLALFNSGNTGASVTIVLRDGEGNRVDQTQVSLASGAHLAQFVAGPRQLFPTLGSLRGSLLVQSSSAVSALVLRQNQTPLSYTSLPVVSTDWSSTTVNLAQVANGSFGNGEFNTSFILFNLTGGATVNVTLALTADDGSPLILTIPGIGTGGRFSFSLPASGAIFMQTDGQGALTTGTATITSTAPIGASGIFSVFDTGGAFLTEAGVGNSPILSNLTIPVDMGPDSDTGVSFFNPSASETVISLKLMDSSGALLDQGTSIQLGAGSHTARFVSQLFPGVRNYRGSLAVVAPSAVAALTLLQNESPLSYTTLPVASGTASGIAPPTPLLPAEQSGVAVKGDMTVNQVLAYGFRLTGYIAGSFPVDDLKAIRDDGKIYAGEVDPDTDRFVVAVDQGTYTIQVCYELTGTPGGTPVSVTYVDPASVSVVGDTTRQITLPSPETFAVTGKVSGLAGLPDVTGAAVVFTSNDNSVQGTFPITADGSYAGSLPEGSYRAAVTVPVIYFTPIQNQSLALYNLLSVDVKGAPVAADLSIPVTAKVSGQATAGWMTGTTFGIKIIFSDTSALPVSERDCVTAPSLTVANADPSGQYQMLVARDRTYAPSLTVPLRNGSKQFGTLGFVPVPGQVTPGGETTVGFGLPDLPAQVTITGKVTNSKGEAVAGALVAASTQSAGGATTINFTASATTDSQGSYSMILLSGTGYRVQFIPPSPTP